MNRAVWREQIKIVQNIQITNAYGIRYYLPVVSRLITVTPQFLKTVLVMYLHKARMCLPNNTASHLRRLIYVGLYIVFAFF
jgi:hypothetical protein